MANTITAFYEFSAGSKARAAHVNTNFSNFRGDLVPINTDTATASDSAHDLGSSEHRWKGGYLGTINLEGSTSTTDVKLVPDTTVTSGAADLLFGTTTITSYDQYGMKPSGQGPLYAQSPSGSHGKMSYGYFSSFNTSTGYPIDTTGYYTLTSIRFTTGHDGLVEVGCASGVNTDDNNLLLAIFTTPCTFLACDIYVKYGLTTTSLSTLYSYNMRVGGYNITSTANNGGGNIYYKLPISILRGFLNYPTANTEYVFELGVQGTLSNTATAAFNASGMFFAKSVV